MKHKTTFVDYQQKNVGITNLIMIILTQAHIKGENTKRHPPSVNAILSGKANSPPCFFVFCVRYIVKVSTFRKCSLHLLNHLGNENLVILQYQECINVYRVIPEQLYFTRVKKNQKIMVSLDIEPLSKRTRWEISLYLAAKCTG